MIRKMTAVIVFAVLIIGTAAVPAVQGVDYAQLEALMVPELLTNEAGFAVTKDLDFSKINTLAASYGFSVVWHSSRQEVLSVRGSSGIVFRKDVDVNVTLTAEVQASPVFTKEFDFTVKSVYSDVRTSDNFYYPNDVGKSIMNTALVNKGWAIVSNAADEKYQSVLTEDYMLKTSRNTPDATDYRTTRFLFPGSPKAASLKMKMMNRPNMTSDASSNREMFFYIYGKQNNSTVKLLEFRFRYYGTNSPQLCVYEAKAPSVEIKLCPIAQSGEWFDFELVMDGETGSYDVYIDDIRKTAVSRTFLEGENKAEQLSYLLFSPYRYATDSHIYLDEIALCSPIPRLSFQSPVFKRVESGTETEVAKPTQGQIKMELTAVNETGTPKDVTLLTAAYRQDNHQLVRISGDTKSVADRGLLSSTLWLEEGEIYDYFIIDTLQSAKPYYVPVTKPFGVAAQHSYVQGGVSVRVSWSPSFNRLENEPNQYIICRNGVEIGRVDSSSSEYFENSQTNVFEDAVYSVYGSTDYGKCSDQSVTEYVPQPVYCPPSVTTDNMTGRTWQYLDFFGQSIMRPYFTQRSWAMDNERFIFSDYNKFIYEYHTGTFMVKKIGEYFGTYVSMTMAPKSNNFYFINPSKQIVKMDMDTYSETVVKQLPSDIYLVTDLGVSDDETVISLDCYTHVAGIPVDGRIAWYNVAKDELHLEVWRDFTQIDGQGYYSMHTMINPVYTDLLLYCSGGSYTGPEPFRSYTRVWLHNIATGTDYNFFKQYQIGYHPAGINYGEQNCHETWTCDGENLVINKARSILQNVKTYVGIPGIVLLDKNGRDRKYVGCPKITSGGVTYELYTTHPGVSAVNPRWVITDTGHNFTFNQNHWPIFLVDTESGKMEPIANPPHNGYSDFHPHPSTSQDGNKLIFGTTSESGVGRIAWMDISDMVQVPQDGQRVQLSASCEALDYTGFEYELEQVTLNGEQAFKINQGKKMYINVDNDVVWGVKADVTLSVTYFDNSLLPMQLEYYVWMDEEPTHKLDLRTLQINRTNTNQWQTKQITLNGINLDNMELLATDMKLSGGSEVYIKQIAVQAG